jgi:ankyrin repeat protein
LIEAGADPDDGGKVSTPMMWAAQNGHGNLVTLLLKNGADISKKVQNLTPLQFAVLTGNIPMFKLLVVRGAYVLISICS